MTTAKKPATFASVCLDNMKALIAAHIRHEIRKEKMKYPVAQAIFGLSGAGVSRIMNGKEASMSFETLHNAAVTAGITISMQLDVPK